ncbi:uncharacterized protein B0T23DRAFT_388331 [Neurospora hispaniola]|uniref:Uncharacterized protein n=1 Tax=Neurospora hispaniola TaxID=588809 RepID=A0AAJ0MMX5_9PEZI|nr:hypothetical protein B0T23DRAFT_388331 [Neurospora hispaniola]
MARWLLHYTKLSWECQFGVWLATMGSVFTCPPESDGVKCKSPSNNCRQGSRGGVVMTEHGPAPMPAELRKGIYKIRGTTQDESKVTIHVW